MSSKKTGSFLRKIVASIIILSIFVVAAYLLLPKLLVQTVMSDKFREMMPPSIGYAIERSKKTMPQVLSNLNLRPDQAIEEIDRIDIESVEAVLQRISEQETNDTGKVAEIIIDEFGFNRIDKNRAKLLFRKTVSKKDVKHVEQLLRDNKWKIRPMLPAIRNSMKELVLASAP